MGLVGRDPELETVGRAVEAVRAGGGQVLGVLGEAGIGKSALLAEIAERAAQAGMLVLRGRGVEHEREVPFGVVVDAFDGAEALDAGVAELLPVPAGHDATRTAGAVERFHRNRALRALLESLGRERAVALVLDDLQWADEASLELVLHLLRRPPAMALLLVFASRPVDPAPRLLDAARGAPGFAQLALEPLGREASLRLLASVGDPARREAVAREAGGNPFFLDELARAAGRSDDALPRTVLAAVTLECAALPPAARALLDGAAVAGDPFDPELAVAAAGAAHDPAACEALVASDLVRADASSRAFSFRHPLIRRAVYDAAPAVWRLAAHERAARELERRGAAAGLRAHHVARYARPGDASAIAVLCEAAAAAAPSAAARWYEAALRLLPDADREGRVALLVPLAQALGDDGRLDGSRAALLQALELVDSQRRVELSVACARVETLLRRHADARRRLLAVRSTAPPASRAALTFELAAGSYHQGRVGELAEWAEPALQAADEVGQPLLVTGAAALAALGAMWAGDPGRSAVCLDRAETGLAELNDAAVSTLVGTSQFLCERYTQAAATSAGALETARRTGPGPVLVTLLGLRAIVALNLLELDTAACEAGAAEELARLQRIPHLVHFALWIRALVHEQRDEHDAAERCALEGARLTPVLESSKLTRTGACDFAAILAAHEPDRAVCDMRAAAGPQLEHADPSSQSWLLLRLVRATLSSGAIAEAEARAERAEDHTRRLGLPAGAVVAACARAEVLLARDQPAQAVALVRSAAGAAERVPAPLAALEARLLEGRALVAAGDTGAAEVALRRAADDAMRTDARRIHRAAAQQLRLLGVRAPRVTPRAGSGQLTERERAIADLVAQGHSNQRVAATLYLSEKTVANTLTRVYAKLGVRTRTQLARTHVASP